VTGLSAVAAKSASEVTDRAMGKLQETSRRTNLSKLDKKARQKQDLLDLEADLIAFAKQAKAGEKPDSSMTEMVEQIMVLLDQMATEIENEFDAVIRECTVEHACYEECREKHVGNYSCHPADESFAIGHRRCRRQQWGMWQHYLSLLQQLAYREQIRDYWCLKWQLNETDSTWPPDTQCMYPASQYAQHGKYALSKFYEDQHGYWSTYYNRIVYSREQCHLASWWYNYTFQEANNASKAYLVQKTKCDGLQDELNEKGCEYKKCYDFCPDGYMTCYWNCHGHCNSPYTETRCDANACSTGGGGGYCCGYRNCNEQAEELKDFVRLVLRIKCLINALTAWDVGKAIDMCVQKEYCASNPSFTCTENYDSKYDDLTTQIAAGQGPIPADEAKLCEIFLKKGTDGNWPPIPPPQPPQFCKGGGYKKLGVGCAGQPQVSDVGGEDAKQNVQACYQSVMSDDQCKGDYFTYNERSDKSCGCKKVGTLDLTVIDCPDSDYYETVTFPHWEKYLPGTELYKKYYYRGCFNLNITCRQKCCDQLIYLTDELKPPVYHESILR